MSWVLIWGGLCWLQASFVEKQAQAGNFRVTVNNLGMIGNSFKGSYLVQGYKSAEFPKGSGIEHVFEGGLWVGVKKGGTVIVSTGAVDDPTGYTTGKAGFEFTAEPGATLLERSSLPDQPTFQPDAVSHQDFVADFTDRNTIVPGTQIPIQNLENGPIGVDVHQEVYNWNYSFANFFLIYNFTLRNSSQETWDSLYVGYWVDFVVRNTTVTPAGSGGTQFYNKGGNGYIDTLYLAYEFDAAGDVGFTDTYVGLKFLGSEYRGEFYHPARKPVPPAGFGVNFQSWTFRDYTGQFRSPQTDADRWLKMSQSLASRPDWATVVVPSLRAPGNRSVFLSAGPFLNVAPGDSVRIAFAFVFARKVADGNPNSADTPTQKGELVQNAIWAQAAYNGEDQNFNGQLDPGEDLNANGKLDRFLLPSPPAVPRIRYEIEPNRIRLYWDASAEESIDPISRKKDFEGYRIYKTTLGFEVRDVVDVLQSLKLVAQFDRPGNGVGYDNGFGAIRLAQPRYFPGDPTPYTYMYEFKGVTNGWQYGIALTTFDEGDPGRNLEPLESSKEAGLRRVFAGAPPNRGFAHGDPYVYPNPYYARAAWEGSSPSYEDKRIMFANLPPHCEVSVYTAAGDLVYRFEHHEDQPALQAQTTRWYQTYSDPDRLTPSGGEHGWNLLSRYGQILARGLYVFAVKDLETGEVRTGKFVIIR
uniref:Uncharacterized protein n=1 Tax=uncultured Bacteroidota bacterium TaxID=152509 RepID=H5SK36_9BACT|nr:hypothetical protein HGMM_F40B03C10 [uncultured Bacteroidetes bacterium]